MKPMVNVLRGVGWGKWRKLREKPEAVSLWVITGLARSYLTLNQKLWGVAWHDSDNQSNVNIFSYFMDINVRFLITDSYFSDFVSHEIHESVELGRGGVELLSQ